MHTVLPPPLGVLVGGFGEAAILCIPYCLHHWVFFVGGFEEAAILCIPYCLHHWVFSVGGFEEAAIKCTPYCLHHWVFFVGGFEEAAILCSDVVTKAYGMHRMKPSKKVQQCNFRFWFQRPVAVCQYHCNHLPSL